MVPRRAQLAKLMMVLWVVMGACSGKPASITQQSHGSHSKPELTEFDGQRAWEHVRRLVEMGPRPVGSEAHRRSRDYIIEQLKKLKIQVEKDEFVGQTPRGPWAMTNIIGKLPGRTEDVIVMAGHYDTKVFSDFQFVGANDGGSSTGAVLEMARVLAGQSEKARPQVWFVFFDGEEAAIDWTATDSKYGSRHLAQKWQKEGVLNRIRALILLDMIGDKNLDIKRDAYSTRSLSDALWQAAAQLGYSDYFLSGTTFIDDDHVPFLQAGVPAVDIIDFNYGMLNHYWHSEADTLDKLSPASLKIVGDVVLHALPSIEMAAARVR
ncbi:MAG: M28 family peptidase [Acidobacteria bacterium]|nr:M28 family peptidase [Acidobacteriota bacterium]